MKKRQGRKRYRGKWAGLTSRTIAELMGCTRPTALAYLRQLALAVGYEECINCDDLGRMIHNFRQLSLIERRDARRIPKSERVLLIVPGLADRIDQEIRIAGMELGDHAV